MKQCSEMHSRKPHLFENKLYFLVEFTLYWESMFLLKEPNKLNCIVYDFYLEKNIVESSGKQEFPKSGAIFFKSSFLYFLSSHLERKRGVNQGMVERRKEKQCFCSAISYLLEYFKNGRMTDDGRYRYTLYIARTGKMETWC